MKPSHENSILSLLQKWLKGDVNRRQEKQLEDLAVNDSFLSEALEGYIAFPESEHDEALNRLHNKIQKRTTSSKVRTLAVVYRIAAAVAFLVIAIFGFQYLQNQISPELAVVESLPAEPEPEKKSEIPLASVEMEKELTALEKIESHTPPPEKETSIVTERKEPNIPFTKRIAPEPAQAKIGKTSETPAKEEEGGYLAEQIVSEEEGIAKGEAETMVIPLPEIRGNAAETIGFADRAITAEEVDPPVELPKEYNNTDLEENDKSDMPPAGIVSKTRTLSGIITDESGEPLIGATVLIDGTDKGTIADFEGQFSIDLEEEEKKLTISYTGYSSHHLNVPATDSFIQVNLSSGMALNEVVVTNYGARSKRRSRAKMAESTAARFIPSAEPEGGFSELEQYIQDNLQYPPRARNKGIEGSVVLRFNVHPDGHLSDFKVLESLGAGCDKEAKRLMKNGPKWRTDQVQVMTYTINFK
ncbi:MAG: TonB family protein [Bacteroidetes bacterium]|nr:TonB family protein [Bacteroidota bacterium]